MTTRVAVVGASGFVGSAVVRQLAARGIDTLPIVAPRVVGTVGAKPPLEATVSALSECLEDATCVVNAAGVADALEHKAGTLDGANGLLPGLLARACLQRGVRLVHVSSAAVQGRLALDSTERYEPFSAYSRSKVLGEHAALAPGGDVCVFRPPGVHAPSRRVTQSVISLARSPLSSVAAPGTDNAPHAQLVNVADAICFLALHASPLPPIVHLPSEGLGTAALLTALGGDRPTLVPRAVARFVSESLRLTSRLNHRVAGHARRLEILWFGQQQADSWLSTVGWTPPMGVEGWETMSTVADQEVDR